MSVWSKSHCDLAKLVKTLQDNNRHHKERSVVQRTRSLSPKTRLSRISDGVKKKPVLSVSFDLQSTHRDSPVVNGRADTETLDFKTTTPRENINSTDGNDSCFSDSFLQSPESDYSDVFQTSASTSETSLNQNGASHTSEDGESSPISKETEYSDSVDAIFPEPSTAEISTTPLKCSDEKTPETHTDNKTKLTLNCNGLSPEELTDIKDKEDVPVANNTTMKNCLSNAGPDPFSPRLSVRSPGLLKKLREMTFSVRSNKSRSNANDKAHISRCQSFTSVTNASRDLANENRPFPSENGDQLLSVENKTPCFRTENILPSKDGSQVCKGDTHPAPENRELSPDLKNKNSERMDKTLSPRESRHRSCLSNQRKTTPQSDLLQTDRNMSSNKREGSIDDNNNLESVTSDSSLSDKNPDDAKKNCMTDPGEEVASTISLTTPSCSEKESQISVNGFASSVQTNDSGTETQHTQQQCMGEGSMLREAMATSLNGVTDVDNNCDPSSPPSMAPGSVKLNNYTPSTSADSGSLTTQTQATTSNSVSGMVPVSVSALSVTQSVVVDSRACPRVPDTGCCETASLPMSHVNGRNVMGSGNATWGTAVPSSAHQSILKVHDMDLKLVPLSSIGIMVGSNGFKYELTERSRDRAVETKHSSTLNKELLSEAERTLNSHTSVKNTVHSGVSPPETCPALHKDDKTAGQSPRHYQCSSVMLDTTFAVTCSPSPVSSPVSAVAYYSPDLNKQSTQTLFEIQTTEMQPESRVSGVGHGETEMQSEESSVFKLNRHCPDTHVGNTQTSTHSQTNSGVSYVSSSFTKTCLCSDSIDAQTPHKKLVTQMQLVRTKPNLMTLGGEIPPTEISMSIAEDSLSDPPRQHSQPETCPQTVDQKLNMNSISPEIVSKHSSFTVPDRLSLAASNDQLNKGTFEMQARETKIRKSSLLSEQSSRDSSFHSHISSPDLCYSGMFIQQFDRTPLKTKKKCGCVSDGEISFENLSPRSSNKPCGNISPSLESHHVVDNPVLEKKGRRYFTHSATEYVQSENDGMSSPRFVNKHDRSSNESLDDNMHAFHCPASDHVSRDMSNRFEKYSYPQSISYNSQGVHHSQDYRSDTQTHSLSNTSVKAVTAASENKTERNLFVDKLRQGEVPKMSVVPRLSLSSIGSQPLSQARSVQVESESEKERSVSSTSVQVSLSGSSEGKHKSPRSHKDRTRPKDGRLGRNSAGVLSQSQTSLSSSVDSLLSVSDNGGGSGYCSDGPNYVTSSSRSRDNRRRLKKLLTVLRFPEQSAMVKAADLSDFNQTVAELQHLCFSLSRNLEQQTQQQLLEQQQQQLRLQQQQLLGVQALQDQQRLQEKQHSQSTQYKPRVSEEGEQKQLYPQQNQGLQQNKNYGTPEVKEPLCTQRTLRPCLKKQVSIRRCGSLPNLTLKSPVSTASLHQSAAGLHQSPASLHLSPRVRSVALSAADLQGEALIEEACKHTELLDRLGVDRDVFRTDTGLYPEHVPQRPLSTPLCGETEQAKTSGAVDDHEMETPEEAVLKLDEEFDKMLVDMKPHVLKLPLKSDRQKCAVWIKKLCEPPSSGITGRKNRNMHSQVMLHMLRRGSLQSPFDRKPEDGPLHPLPSYMSIYFDEPLERPDEDAEKLPDWVEGELGESVGSSLFHRSEGLGNPAATSTWVSNAGSSLRGVRQRPHTSMGISLDKDPGLSPIRGDHRHHTGYSAQSDMEWTRPLGVTASSTTSFAKGTHFQDDTTMAKPGDKEIALRTKMIEAKYHEEKLRLQQKHDSAVQKILDRKNSEIEDVKSHYRSKTKELEETITKLERKVQTLVKEAGAMRETKDKQIGELKRMVEDSSESQRNEYEKRIHDLEADFEQQKFEFQKLHTRNIQEILDDTNARLQRMDAEYNQQATSTANIIKELESRVQQLMGEVDRTLSQRSTLEKEKAELYSRVDKLSTDLDDQQQRNKELEREQQKRLETSEHEMRTLRNKTEASLEFLKQEHSIAASKAADTVADLEQQVDYLKKALKEAEEQRQRQMRETEQVHQQDKLHLENLHDKQVRSMKKELEQLEQEMQRKLSRLEQLLHDKEAEVQKEKELSRQQMDQSDKALVEFKQQVEKNQNKIYADMKQQMEQVEADLNKSKQAREKQSREFSRQLDEAQYKHEHELTEMKMNFDNEKAQILHDVHMQKELATGEHERELDQLRENHRADMKALESRYKERQEKDSKISLELDGQVTDLREELVQANQLRKQQLVELGLLREEEKQKMQREHEAEIARLRTDGEQQRLELQKMHSAETEKLLEKTNDRLKSIEREYIERGKKSSETITELQNSIKLLRDDIKRAKETAEDRVVEVRSQSEEEKQSLRKQYSSNLSIVQHELESQRNRCHNLDRQIQKLEADHEEKMTRLKLDHEERVRGLLPSEMKQELEDTISSLKSQVSTLQQRAAMLQEELDLRLKNPLGPFGSRTSSPIKSV